MITTPTLTLVTTETGQIICVAIFVSTRMNPATAEVNFWRMATLLCTAALIHQSNAQGYQEEPTVLKVRFFGGPLIKDAMAAATQ